MKKVISVVLVLILSLSLVSCFGELEEGVKKPIIDNDGSANGGSGGSGDQTGSGGKQNAETPTITEQVCFDSHGVKVTAKSIVEDPIWGVGVKLLLENSSSRTYSVSVSEVIVNNCMVTSFFSSEVAAGKKANDTLYLSSRDLKAAGIDNIGLIEIYFYLFDSESFDTVFRAECSTIKTSLYDKMDTTPNDTGKELYHQNNIRIVGKYVDEDSFWGSSVLLFIENKTGKNITVSAEDMSINGYMVTPLFSSTVFAGKYTIDDITILSSDLEENSITSIDTIELKFNIYDADTLLPIAKTPTIRFSTK